MKEGMRRSAATVAEVEMRMVLATAVDLIDLKAVGFDNNQARAVVIYSAAGRGKWDCVSIVELV